MQHTSLTNHRIQPHTGQVLVQLHDGREQDATIVIPGTSNHQANPFGMVISVGDGVEGVSPKDKLIFAPNAMLIQILYNGEKFCFVDAKHILGKYVSEETSS